jgi:predicted acylesterase/phospholipase RssA
MYSEIVIGGGGTNGIAYIGALHWMYTNGYLKEVKRWVGTSIGGVLSFLMIIGYTPEIIYRVFSKIKIEKVLNVRCEELLSFFDTLGLFDMESFFRICYIFMDKKSIPRYITFKQLYDKTSTALVITGYNIHTSTTDVFSHEKTPNMPVTKALQITACVPLIFRPIKWNDMLYIDGGYVECCPIKESNFESTLILNLKTKTPITMKVQPSLPEYLQVLIKLMAVELSNTAILKYPDKIDKILYIPVPNAPIINFYAKEDNIKDLFRRGVKAAKKITKKPTKNTNQKQKKG